MISFRGCTYQHAHSAPASQPVDVGVQQTLDLAWPPSTASHTGMAIVIHAQRSFQSRFLFATIISNIKTRPLLSNLTVTHC